MNISATPLFPAPSLPGSPFSLDEVERALPPQYRGSISQEIVDDLNKAIKDPEFARALRDNLVSYTGVLREGKFKLADYMSAVTYVSYKLMGESDREAYVKTFPDRYQTLVLRQTSSKDIASYIAAYNRGALVNKILEQTMIPSWVLNQDVYQQAINTQVELMLNSKRDDVRQKAADSIMNHLKRPEATKVELTIGEKSNPQMDDFREQMREMVQNQRKMIEQGASTKDIAHQTLIAKSVVEDAVMFDE